MGKRSIVFIAGLLLLMMVMPVSAAQLLPLSPWYAIVYQQESDSLHWMNAAGEQAMMARPHLPNEAQYLDMRISPNGRTMVIVAQLNNGVQGLGVYDFASDMFVQTHQAQTGETIHLGGKTIFTANSQSFAVGFFSGDFSTPAWRVILFDSLSGNAQAFIDHTHPDAPELPLSAPAVQYIDGAYVHFQMIQQATDGWYTWPTLRWRAFGIDPSQPVISESPYNLADIQIQLLTGSVAVIQQDANYATLPSESMLPSYNAIATGVIANEAPLTTIHADGTRFHRSAKWAKGGEWVLFYSSDLNGDGYWNIVLANGTPGNNSHMPFDPQFTQVYGTGDGYLLVNDQYQLFYSNGFMPNTAQNIAQLTPLSKVVYVTPMGVNFMLGGIEGQAEQVAQPIITPTPAVIATPTSTPQAEAPTDCSSAPSQRVGIGTQARVLPSMGGLNLRQDPNGAIILTLAGGDSFKVIGGAICNGGLYWWQIERGGTIGWLAEGSSSGYFIEPYAGDPVPPAEPVPPIVEEEAQPEPPASPTCGSALPIRLSVGKNAVIARDMLRPHVGPGADAIDRKFYTAGTSVSVTAGPECVGGQNWWLVMGQAKVGRIGNQYEAVQGWVAESSDNAYNLAP